MTKDEKGKPSPTMLAVVERATALLIGVGLMTDATHAYVSAPGDKTKQRLTETVKGVEAMIDLMRLSGDVAGHNALSHESRLLQIIRFHGTMSHQPPLPSSVTGRHARKRPH